MFCATCSHWGGLHDIYEVGDPYPACCVGGCRCGHPGDAIIRRDANGTRYVDRADRVIRVSRELLDNADRDVWDGETLTLDSAGEYRYVHLRRDSRDERVDIFGRV